MKRVIVLSILCVMAASSAFAQNHEGEWFACKDNVVVRVAFSEGGRFSIFNEAASNMSFECSYTVSDGGRKIDLPDFADGMGGAGIMRFNADGSMEMNIVLGIPGFVKRPESIDSHPSSPENLYLHLYRDRSAVEAMLPEPEKIPEEASLAFERNRRLGAGINLNAVVDGNLHPGYERDAPLKDGEIKSIADAGFSSVRLNVCWSKHCSTDWPYVIDPVFFDKVDGIVDECLRHGLAVSLDVHYYPYINMNDPDRNLTMDENYDRLVCLWGQIAEHYKDYSDETLFFDLLNEPNLSMSPERWNGLLSELIKTVRKTNPGRTILVATPSLGQSWTLNLLDLPEGEWNVIVEFHYYLPHLFTHQSLSYAMAGHVKGMEWKGSDEERKPIESDLDYCRRWSEKNGRPLNMGEYGVTNTADEKSRALYIGFMKNAAESRGFSSHLWGYREPFMIKDEKTGRWIRPILDAMDL